MQLVILAADAFAEVSLAAVEELWKRWLGPERFHRKLAQFEALGLVERPVRAENVERIVRLTEQGRLAALGGRDPEMAWRRQWDGRWRLALFDIPEAKASLRLRFWRQLRSLGFGYLQHSVWISPDSTSVLRHSLEGAELDVGTLTFMEAKPCGGESDADLVLEAWDFGRINRNYEVYLDLLKSQPSQPGGRAWQNWFKVEWKAWGKAIRDDPLLPVALLPKGYKGREAWERRVAVLRRLFRTG